MAVVFNFVIAYKLVELSVVLTFGILVGIVL